MSVEEAINTPRGQLTRIGAWELGETLGRGAYAHVRYAKHIVSGREAACKILPSLYSSGEPPSKDDLIDAIEIHKELVLLKALAGAKIPGVVGLEGVLEENGWHYIFLTLHRHSLRSTAGWFIKAPHSEFAKFVAKLLRTVEALHNLGITHEDLKGANILVDQRTPEPYPIVVDFGFSHFIPNGGLVTGCGGTLDYSSPEKAAGVQYDPKASDVWSLGILLLKMRGYPHPYLDDEEQTTKDRIDFGPPSWNWKKRDLTNGFAIFIQAMLERDLKKRITIPDLLKHPYLARRPSCVPTAIPIPPQRLSTKVSRPVSPVVLQDVTFLLYVTGQLVLCETSKTLQKRLYGRMPCWEQQMANLLTAWERSQELEWEDERVWEDICGGRTGKPVTRRGIGRPLREIHVSPTATRENRAHSPRTPGGENHKRLLDPVTPPRKVLVPRLINIPSVQTKKVKTRGFGRVRV